MPVEACAMCENQPDSEGKEKPQLVTVRLILDSHLDFLPDDMADSCF